MIWAVVGLLLVGLAAGPFSAGVLTRGRWQVVHPRRALMAWLLVGALGISLAVAATMIAATLSLSASSAGTPVEGMALTLIAWMGLGGLGIVGSLAQLGRSDLGDESDEQLSISELLSRRRTDSWQMGAVTVVEIEDHRVVAMAVTGTTPAIFVSRTIRHALPTSHLSAVLAHEAAHLSQHHALVRRLGAWHAACLPKRSQLRRDFASRITLLTELAADDAAAAQVGPAHLHSALTALHNLTASRELEVRAARVRALHRTTPLASADSLSPHGTSGQLRTEHH